MTLASRRPTTALAVPCDLEAALRHAADLMGARWSAQTRRAYLSDFRHFRSWCDRSGLDAADLFATAAQPIAADVLAAYLAACDLARLSPRTIKRRAAAIAALSRARELPSPTDTIRIKSLLAGLARSRAKGGRSGARPFTISMLQACLPKLSIFERAVMLVGLVGGLRRSEIKALEWGWFEPSADGWVCTMGPTKNHPEGGHVLGLPRSTGNAVDGCPVAALRDHRLEQWRGRPAPRDALVFPVSESTIYELVRRAAGLAGESPDDFSPHSLRSAFLTIASARGVPLPEIMEQTGHRSVDVASRYIKHGLAAQNRAAIEVVASLKPASA